MVKVNFYIELVGRNSSWTFSRLSAKEYLKNFIDEMPTDTKDQGEWVRAGRFLLENGEINLTREMHDDLEYHVWSFLLDNAAYCVFAFRCSHICELIASAHGVEEFA